MAGALMSALWTRGCCRTRRRALSRPGGRRVWRARPSGAVVRGGGVTPPAIFLNESGLLEMFERIHHLAWG